MKHSINMRPSGIAWENEDVVFVTKAGIAHTSQGENINLHLGWDRKEIASRATKPLSKNFVVVGAGEYCVYGYDVNVVNKEDDSESYVSFVGMYFSAMTVGDFEACYGLRETENPNRYRKIRDAKDSDYYIEGVHVNARADAEMRVYKDKTAVVLIRITYNQGTDAETERYFVLPADFYVWNYISRLKTIDPSCADLASAGPILKDVVEIRDESEIRKHAFKWKTGSKAVRDFLNGSSGREMKSHDGDRCPGVDSKFDMVNNCYVRSYFPTSLRKEIDAFFGIDLPENSAAKSIFDTRCLSIDWRHTRKKEDGIASPEFLDKWLGLKVKGATAEKKRIDDDNAIWSSIHWGDRSIGNRIVTWERREIGGSDFIIASYRDFDSSYRHHAAFVYDVKRRVRKVLVPAGSGDDKCKSIIPSLGNAILGKFDMNPTREWDYSKGDYVDLDDGPKQVIVGGLSVKELFAGTNVGWILENEREFGDDMYYLFPKDANSYWFGDDSIRIRKIQEDIADGVRIGQIALCILATTGKPVMEQLLKSRMFRLYFLAIYGEARGEHGYFWDVSKKVADRYDYCAFPYTSKGKNLKEMFGMSLNQLRMCDKAVDIERVSTGSSFKYEYRTPRLGHVAECLGVERLSDIDDALFAKVIAMTRADFPSSGWYPPDAKTVFSASVTRSGDRIMELLKNNTPKERVAFLASIPGYDGFSVMNDYLRMRQHMASKQKEKPEEDIFDEKEFPAKVGKSVKFIRFMPGMSARSVNGGYRWESFYGGPIRDQAGFVRYLRAKYLPYATEKGSVQLEINEKGAIVGAIVKMNPTQHMSFLHDELSEWYNIFDARSGDGGKAKEFKKATGRVGKLVWSDPKTGLSIVAPKDVADLRKEGSVLSHCVASYVGPIIEGGHNIMFIRRSDMLDEPYYTLDVDDGGNVLEIHGYRNSEMGDAEVDAAYAETGREVYSKHFDIEGFLSNWCKAMKGKIKKESLKRSYGRLEVVA